LASRAQALREVLGTKASTNNNTDIIGASSDKEIATLRSETTKI